VNVYLALAGANCGKRPTRTVVGITWGVDEVKPNVRCRETTMQLSGRPTGSNGPIALIRCPKHHASLILPRQSRTLGQLHDGYGCDLPLVDQPFQHLRGQICQPQLPADMALCEVHGLGKFLNGGKLADLYAPPPGPSAAD
jgi:hypothetical protein